ncbi:MAG: fatty acid desaturase [Candidatus Omnitrophica bacterium]|nr:fatty acid desaturase [Candidatus Omnitrophota bacterium]
MMTSPVGKKYNFWVIGWILLMHLGALAAPFTFTWPAFFLFLFLSWVTGGIGICLCYHRLLTHASFRVPKPLEYFLTFLGVLASEGGPINWVARHRIHHAYPDTERDPHSPRQGFWWSHMFWLFKHKPILDNYELYSPYAKDLARDPVHRFLNNTHGLYQIFLGVILYLWGGFPFLVWGLFLRTVFVYHITWFVNSATHKWGYKSYAVNDDSSNLWWVALLSFGEGWHNNHHAFQRSARHGLKFWEFDQTYLTIKFLELLKLARHVHLPKLPKFSQITKAPQLESVTS